MRRVQIGIVGETREGVLEIGVAALKKGAVILTLDNNTGRELKVLDKGVVCFGKGDYPARIDIEDEEVAALVLVKSADAIITVGEGELVDFVTAIGKKNGKPVVSGERAVEKAFEKLVRYSLFGAR